MFIINMDLFDHDPLDSLNFEELLNIQLSKEIYHILAWLKALLNLCVNTHTHKHLHSAVSVNKIKLEWVKPEINYPSKANVLENIIYGTIMKMVRLSENPTII